MPRKPQPWFRFYVETIDDDKLLRHPPAWCWLWTVVMALARRSPVPGRLLITEGTPHTAETIATKARVPVGQVRKALGEFTKDEMVTQDGDCWVVTNFLARQFESDNVTERTRKHRSNGHARNDVGTFQPEGLEQDPLCKAAESRPQSPELAASEVFTHNGCGKPAAAALPEVVKEAFGIIIARRLAAHPPDNPAAYTAHLWKALPADHADRLATLDVGTFTPEQLAELLEPVVPPKPRFDAVGATTTTDGRTFLPGTGWVS